MPQPELLLEGTKTMEAMRNGPVAQGWFGWPVSDISLRYLFAIGYVRIFYDWDALKTKAELTPEGRARLEAETAKRQTALAATT